MHIFSLNWNIMIFSYGPWYGFRMVSAFIGHWTVTPRGIRSSQQGRGSIFTPRCRSQLPKETDRTTFLLPFTKWRFIGLDHWSNLWPTIFQNVTVAIGPATSRVNSHNIISRFNFFVAQSCVECRSARRRIIFEKCRIIIYSVMWTDKSNSWSGTAKRRSSRYSNS